QLDELGEDFGSDPVCVGPFSFVERPDQDRVVVEQSEHFYDADDVEVEQITFLSIEDNAVAVNNLRSGEVDISNVAPVNAEEVEGDGSLNILNRPGTGYVGFTVNLGLVDG